MLIHIHLSIEALVILCAIRVCVCFFLYTLASVQVQESNMKRPLNGRRK